MRAAPIMPSPKPWSPWKVLIVAILACAVCFVLVVGGTIYFFVTFTNAHKARATRQRAEEHERVFRRIEELGATNDVRTTNTLAPRRALSAPRTNTVARNAIVARGGTNKPHAGDDIFRDSF